MRTREKQSWAVSSTPLLCPPLLEGERVCVYLPCLPPHPPTAREGMSRFWMLLLLLAAGCDGATGNIHATDPTERGLSYVAAAIVTHAVIRAFFH